MLQISTGKFFDTDDTYNTIHRGVLYSNLRLMHVDCVTTQVGTLSPAARWGDIETLVCEVVERQPNILAAGTILSVGPDAFINDFAAVSSFYLERVLTPDHDLAMRLLTAQRPPLGISRLPKQFVSNVFDMSLPYAPQVGERLSSFFTDLLKLERKSFSGAMRAIRRYVTAMHRLADDLDLAYSLFVAAIESLAQEFDGFKPVWEDYDQRKRKPVDAALSNAPAEIATAVRDAILGTEHIALSRRFREFSLAHIGPEFFRTDAVGRVGPAGKSDLSVALKKAYQVRSGYVHTLKAIPRLLSSPIALTDLMPIEGVPYLSFEGIARVARTVILEFVRRAPTMERETFAYADDFPNLLQAPLDPSMWLHIAEHYSTQSAYMYLNGFLQQVEQTLMNSDRQVSDLRGVSAKIETLLPSIAKPEQRRPLVALYYWFLHYLGRADRQRAFERQEKYIKELETECAEAFFLYVFEGRMPPWSAEKCTALLESYMRKRYNRSQLNVGSILGAAGLLTNAEMYRCIGDECSARRLISIAVEEFPGIEALRQYEANLHESLQTIVWSDILIPKSVPTQPTRSSATRKKLSKLNRRRSADMDQAPGGHRRSRQDARKNKLK
ncbi:hypothetical protein BCh11DRAFT_07467 [Burkholderia sp. Ch1-1]|nr:hypothetical protein BCh11DRAFT_07467 [Burkholderia sp. Ch1-1]